MFHNTPPSNYRACLKHIGFLLFALLLAIAPADAGARPVMVESNGQQGNGFLFHHRGVCYVILPSHVHSRGAFSLSARDPAGLGTGRTIHKTEGTLDLSLGVVSGSLTGDCGPDWSDLPRAIEARAGQGVSVIRYHSGSVETIRATITSLTFTHFDIAPIPDETRFFAAATSGSFVFDGDRPMGMIVEAAERQDAHVLRWDEIHDRIRRVVEDWYEQEGCTGAQGCDTPLPDAAPATLAGFRLVAWDPQPLTSENGADTMVAGLSPYIAPIAPRQPITLTFEADTIRVISRVTMTSRADGIASVAPKLVTVQIDTSSDGIDRWRNFLSPRDMVPGEMLDLRRGETRARRVQIRIGSGWGRGPVRIDGIGIE